MAQADDHSFASLRLGRTNEHDAAELRGALDLADGTSLQLSVLLPNGRSPVFGFNGVRGLGKVAAIQSTLAL